MVKVNTKDIRTMSMTLFWCYGVFIVNFGQASGIVLVFPLWTLNSRMPTSNNYSFATPKTIGKKEPYSINHRIQS